MVATAFGLRNYNTEIEAVKCHFRSGRLQMVFGEDLGTAIKNSPHTTLEKLAEIFSEHRTPIERPMHALAFIIKLDQ